MRLSGRGMVLATVAICGGFGLATVPSNVSAQDKVVFATDIWPILQQKCVTCHGPNDSFNNLRLDSKDRILRGGKNGKIVVPGDALKSPMFQRVSLPADDFDIMPAEGDPLTKTQIELVRRWIAEGADFGSWSGGS